MLFRIFNVIFVKIWQTRPTSGLCITFLGSSCITFMPSSLANTLSISFLQFIILPNLTSSHFWFLAFEFNGGGTTDCSTFSILLIRMLFVMAGLRRYFFPFSLSSGKPGGTRIVEFKFLVFISPVLVFFQMTLCFQVVEVKKLLLFALPIQSRC